MAVYVSTVWDWFARSDGGSDGRRARRRGIRSAGTVPLTVRLVHADTVRRSVDGRSSEPASWFEDVALVGCLWVAIGLLGTSTLATVLDLGFTPLRDSPAYVVAAFLGSLLVSVGAVVRFRQRLYVVCYGPAAAGDSIWADVTLYCGANLAAQKGGGVLLLPIVAVIGDVFENAFVSLLFLLASAVAGLVVVGGCRSGRFPVPESVRSKPWGLAEYAALFGTVALVAYSYGQALFGVVGEPGRPALAAAVGALAVALRALGVFVPTLPSTPERGEHRALR